MTPYLHEIQRLQSELDRANENIDEKLDRLEDAGFGVVGLIQQLEDERAKNAGLKEDIARFGRREDRRLRQMKRIRCTRCHSKVDPTGLSRSGGDERYVSVCGIAVRD